MLEKFKTYLLTPVKWLKQEIAYRKRLKQLRKNDPFIYK